MENRTIYLVRHTKVQLEDDQQRYIIGQLDLPISEEGVRQAHSLQQIFERSDISAVYCSDLARSRQTAEIIVAESPIPLTPLKELREVAMGEWEGHTFNDIVRRFPNEFKERGKDIGYFRVAGGESFADCGKRAIAVFHDIVSTSAGNIVIVGHAGVNRLILCHLLGMPLANLFRLAQDYGCLNVIQPGKSAYQVKLMNFHSRLVNLPVV